MPKIIHYRDKCIGCGICFQLQPRLWRMSNKDGKATLVKAILKKQVYVLEINNEVALATMPVTKDCPVKIIKLLT